MTSAPCPHALARIIRNAPYGTLRKEFYLLPASCIGSESWLVASTTRQPWRRGCWACLRVNRAGISGGDFIWVRLPWAERRFGPGGLGMVARLGSGGREIADGLQRRQMGEPAPLSGWENRPPQYCARDRAPGSPGVLTKRGPSPRQ